MPHKKSDDTPAKHINTAAFFRGSTQNPMGNKPQDFSPEKLKSNTRRPVMAGASSMPQRASAASTYQLAIREMLTTPITRRA